MPSKRKIALIGAAAIGLVGVAGFAAGKIADTHVLDVRLPDGDVAHVRYVGKTPPKVTIAQAPVGDLVRLSAFDLSGAETPLAAMERESEAMDRQANAMLREVSAYTARMPSDSDLTHVDAGTAPSNLQGATTISTLSGSGVCTRSVEYRSLGDGHSPQVITRVSGACSDAPKTPSGAAISVSGGEQTPPERGADHHV